MKIKYMANLIVCIMVMVLLAGCGDRTAQQAKIENEGYRFTDSLGEDVCITGSQRVVSLMGSFAETWLAAGGELIGVTDDALDGRGLELPEEIASVGKYNNPNVEKIISLAPDLVILSSETKEQVALKGALEQAGITTAYFKVTHFEDYLKMLKICTEITGRKELYEENGLEVQKKIEKIISEVNDKESPRILLLITFSGGAVAQNSESMTGKMLKDLGCENIADLDESLLKEFSMESIVKEDPDFIFVMPMGNDEELATKNLKESIENNPAWKDLTAVKDNCYIILPKERFLYKPNEKWAESYQDLSEMIYVEK